MRIAVTGSIATDHLLVFAGRLALIRFNFFAIKHLTVEGNPTTLSSEEIIQRSGVLRGTNLFSVNIQEIQTKLKTHPYFKTVAVQRHLPDTLVIRVSEYLPEFILSTGRLYYVDPSGDIFKDITDSQDNRDFPVLTGISEEQILKEPARVKSTLQAAVELKRTYQQCPFQDSLGLSEIHFDKNLGFTLYPEKKKYSIKVGLKDFSEKISKLTDHWEQINQSKAAISSIDLNYPGKILMTL